MLIPHVPLLNNSLGSGLELYALRRETTNTCVDPQLYCQKTYNTSGSVETSRFASSTVRVSHTRECCEGNNLLLSFNSGSGASLVPLWGRRSSAESTANHA